jgi:transcriptional regulator with XRE-family HTH domain
MSTFIDASWWAAHGPEARLARSVRALRTARDLTQAGLARKMTDLGFSWHPTTVARVEAGERDISLDEAVALADLLGIPLVDLLRGERTALLEQIATVQKRLAQAAADLARAREMQHRIAGEVVRAEEITARLRAQLHVLHSQLDRANRQGLAPPDIDDHPLLTQ